MKPQVAYDLQEVFDLQLADDLQEDFEELLLLLPKLLNFGVIEHLFNFVHSLAFLLSLFCLLILFYSLFSPFT